jgi:hypothetical protein
MYYSFKNYLLLDDIEYAERPDKDFLTYLLKDMKTFPGISLDEKEIQKLEFVL